MRRRGFVAAVLVAALAIAGAASPASRAARLQLSANDQRLVPWGRANLGYRIDSFQSGPRADLYLAMVQSEGDQCVAPENVFASPPPAFASDLVLADAQGTITEGYLPARVTPLIATLYGVLVPHGASPADPANWLSNLARLDVAMRSLSSSQDEVIAERGNPSSYLIEFSHESEERLDTWLYDGGGVGDVWQFVNGRLLSSPDGIQRGQAGAALSQVAYGPGRFVPGTTPREIRALLGDPDRVLKGAPGTQVWVFNGSQMSVTVKNGVVRQISAY